MLKRQRKLAFAVHIHLCTARRQYRKPLSPDRSHTNSIRDAQNAFRWADKHSFRPHQHFTYDPCSWSRPLTEKAKEERTLSVVQRLKMLEEREREYRSNMNSITEHNAVDTLGEDEEHHNEKLKEDSGGSSRLQDKDSDVPDYFFTVADATPLHDTTTSNHSASTASLQELLDKIEKLRRVLTMPRFSKNASLRIRERQQREYTSTLLSVFERLRTAQVGETITEDAAVYAWFVLLESMEPLLLALVEADASVEVDVVVTRVYEVLQMNVLRVVMSNAGATVADTHAELEAAVELAYILTHPFALRNGTPVYPLPANLSAALHTRLSAPAGSVEGPQREWLDTVHTAALVQAVARHTTAVAKAKVGNDALLEEVQPVSIIRLAMVTRNSATSAWQILRGTTTTSLASEVRHSLSRRPRRMISEGSSSSSSDGHSRLAAVMLDHADDPRGVQVPLTEPDDIYYVLQAACALIRLCLYPRGKSFFEPELKAVGEAVDAVLKLLAHAPNYDLPVSDVVRFVGLVADCSQVANSGSDAAKKERSLRVVLLLSRLPLAISQDRDGLCMLFRHLCLSFAEPEFGSDATRSTKEWRRLRGQVARTLTDTLTAAELTKYDTTAATASVAAAGAHSEPSNWTWETAAAFGLYPTLQLPLSLWREACAQRLGVRAISSTENDEYHVQCSPATAEALVVLRARRNDRTGHLCIEYLARCVSVISGDTISSARCLRDPDAWEEALVYLSTPEAVESVAPLFAAAREFVRDAVAGERNMCSL